MNHQTRTFKRGGFLQARMSEWLRLSIMDTQEWLRLSEWLPKKLQGSFFVFTNGRYIQEKAFYREGLPYARAPWVTYGWKSRFQGGQPSKCWSNQSSIHDFWHSPIKMITLCLSWQVAIWMLHCCTGHSMILPFLRKFSLQ